MKLIAGRINCDLSRRIWQTECEVNLGDYAIVENNKGYDLIEIVGIIETKEEYKRHFDGVKENKKVIMFIPRKDIVKETEEFTDPFKDFE